MSGAINMLSRTFKFRKFWKIFNANKIFKHFQRQFLNFQQNVIYVKEPHQVYMCTKFQVNILKNDYFMAF